MLNVTLIERIIGTMVRVNQLGAIWIVVCHGHWSGWHWLQSTLTFITDALPRRCVLELFSVYSPFNVCRWV